MVFGPWGPDEGYKVVERLTLMVDFVAIYMTNSAEAYFAAFALSKLGVTNAMINSSLKGISAYGG
jgi:acyl-coenzyme A synthetase/AMP-(fatty) acid ligase